MYPWFSKKENQNFFFCFSRCLSIPRDCLTLPYMKSVNGYTVGAGCCPVIPGARDTGTRSSSTQFFLFSSFSFFF